MALIDDVRAVCRNLAEDPGWVALFRSHGLLIDAADFITELHKDLRVDRSLPGFEDFAAEGHRAIEPGKPAHSLLYHALASPCVTGARDGDGLRDLQIFPSLRDLEMVENYIFAARRCSIATLMAADNRAKIGIAVFAYEYRHGAETVHRKHADLCFSRTGLARVGNAPAFYDGKIRGFLPLRDGDKQNTIRVLPARYAAFVAIQMAGDPGSIGPMRFRNKDENEEDTELAKSDTDRLFWIPMHKLFSGVECIEGFDLTVKLRASHRNEKLRRIHLEFLRNNVDAGWKESALDSHPFVIEEGLADLSDAVGQIENHGEGVLLPQPHPLVEEARLKSNERVTFLVPPGSPSLGGSLQIPDRNNARAAPEFVHARHPVDEHGEKKSLNDLNVDVNETVQRGNYRAQHYVDYTADGFVEVACPQLAVDFPRIIPAYSLLTAPDFFSRVSQAELLDWTERALSQKLLESLWSQLPETLADNRMPPNLQLPGADFRPEDTTVSAVVSMPVRASTVQTVLSEFESARHAHLPDAAAGTFAPGWDVAFDRDDNGVSHLASYGLGSPFPEDAKLCAALSAFWPAVAPDANRTFPPRRNQFTVAPLTDSEIGLNGEPSWDGVVGPRLLDGGPPFLVEYPDFVRTDYVENALREKFSLAPTANMSSTEYKQRVLAMARVYQAFGVLEEDESPVHPKSSVVVLSFRKISARDRECRAAEFQFKSKQLTFSDPVYRFEVYKPGGQRHMAKRKVQVEVLKLSIVLVDFTTVVWRQTLPKAEKWRLVIG